jgi:osmotically-inducible protein OsmY
MSSSARDTGRPRRRGRPPKALAQPAEENMEIEDTEALLELEAGLESGPTEDERAREESEDAAEVEEPRPEDHMVNKIRARLQSARGIDASQIQVEVERGVVVLSGHVASDAVRQKVVDSVSANGGVKVIRNRIRLAS